MREDSVSADEKIEIGMIAEPLSSPWWPQIKALLHPALMQGDEDWPQVEPDIAKDAKQVWAVFIGGELFAAAVTRIAVTRGGEVAEVYLVGGRDQGRWLALLSATIESSAREIGCVAVRAYGREGWVKPLAAIGWGKSFVAYEKALTTPGQV